MRAIQESMLRHFEIPRNYRLLQNNLDEEQEVAVQRPSGHIAASLKGIYYKF